MQHGQLRNLRTLEDFKNKQQKLMKVMFFNMLKYIYSDSLLNTPYIQVKPKF